MRHRFKAVFTNTDAKKLRKELGIPTKAKIIGHVGGLHFEKNHDFLIKIFANLAKSNANLHLLLVGDGPLWPKLEQQTKDLGIEDKVSFTGVRQDVPALLQIMDVFAFPSLFEGLGLAIVEAQAAGLPCVIADTIPKEATIIDELVTILPIEHSGQKWCDAIQNALDSASVTKEQALKTIENSDFNILNNVESLSNLYETLALEARSKAV